MPSRVFVAMMAVLLLPARGIGAQQLGEGTLDSAGPPVSVLETGDAIVRMAEQQPLPAAVTMQPGSVTFGAPPPPNPFTSIGRDLRQFFSKDTAMVISVALPATAIGFAGDQTGIEESQEHLGKQAFEPGSVLGSFYVQAGGALGTWAVGKMTGNERTERLGGDLLRSQLVTQTIVQGLKFATRRERPDGSNLHSFPSGHTASAFAAASVVGRHFGPGAGIPAYALATYVGMARMSANKHYVSDVIMGAGIGIAAGRTVTMDIAGAKFALGVTPTPGGGAVVFTKK